MTDQLKPCPVGHDAEIVQNPDGITYSPKCADWNCAWGIDEEFSDPETAAKFWNTRPQDAEVERLRAENKRLRALAAQGGEYAKAYIMQCDTATGIPGAEQYLTDLSQLPEES